MSDRGTARNAWPYFTPSGHAYHSPLTYSELNTLHVDAAQAFLEGWDEAECPPGPTWEMFGVARRHVEKLERRNIRLQDRVDRMTKIINKPDPSRLWPNAGLVAVGAVVGMWVAWRRSA